MIPTNDASVDGCSASAVDGDDREDDNAETQSQTTISSHPEDCFLTESVQNAKQKQKPPWLLSVFLPSVKTTAKVTVTAAEKNHAHIGDMPMMVVMTPQE